MSEDSKPERKMRALQRHKFILDRVRQRGFVTVPDMASECLVSEMTMRRDLEFLADRQLIQRTHGGAAALNANSDLGIDLIEPALHARSEINHAAKMAIARKAATLIANGTTVALDIGSTTLELAEVIADRTINVYTTSVAIAMHLSQRAATVYIPGGRLFGTEPSIVGTQAVKHLSELNFDVAFIGVSGVSENGFYDYSLEDSEMKRALIDGSQKRVVLIDSSKFNRMSVAKVTGFDKVDVIVTEARPPRNLEDLFLRAGIEVLIAD